MTDPRAASQPVDDSALVIAEKERISADTDADWAILECGLQLLRTLRFGLEMCLALDCFGALESFLQLLVLELALSNLRDIRVAITFDDRLR